MLRKFLSVLIVMLAVCAWACADPVLTVGGLTAWIGEDNHMYLIDAAGTVKHLPAAISDLIAMDTDVIYCLTADDRVFSVYTDGSGSNIVFRQPTEEQLASLRHEQSWTYDASAGLLQIQTALGPQSVSANAKAAVESGATLYYVEADAGLYTLKSIPVSSGDILPGLSLFPSSLDIDEPLSLMCSDSALAITHTDGRITLVSRVTGETLFFQASSPDTAAAAFVSDRLFRYSKNEHGYTLQSSEAAVFTRRNESVTATPAPAYTPVPSPHPTSAPTPYVTVRPAPTSTRQPAPTATPEDENIRKGEHSDRVKKVQKRLQALGYPVGRADGTYGNQTQLAVALFQNAVRYSEKDYITPKLYKRLFASDAPVYDQFMALKKGDKGMAVRILQQQLLKIGYKLGKADGIYGKRTVEAVASYMRSIGWYVPSNQVMGETAPRELLMNLFLTPNMPVGPLPTTSTSGTEQTVTQLEQMLR